MESYLSEPLVSRDMSPDLWWRANRTRFPFLSALARTYLAAPPTTVPSESTSSTAGVIISEHRSRLDPENAEMLLFLKVNADKFFH